MNQAITNLVINADEAMPEGGVVNILARNTELKTGNVLPLPQGKYVEIVIEDHGIGIAKESGQPFDVVILDLTVPGGRGGKETIEELVTIDPGVKAIASSGYSGDLVISKYRKYGFRGVLGKPYGIGELTKAIHKLL